MSTRQNYQKLKSEDLKHIWHPYTDITSFEKMDFPIIKRAKGCYIYDMRGNKYLDGIASWWCVNFGHSHPRLIKAIKKTSKNCKENCRELKRERRNIERF